MCTLISAFLVPVYTGKLHINRQMPQASKCQLAVIHLSGALGGRAGWSHSFNRRRSPPPPTHFLTLHLRLAGAPIRGDFRWVQPANELQIARSPGSRANNGKRRRDKGRNGALTPFFPDGRVLCVKRFEWSEGRKFASDNCVFKKSVRFNKSEGWNITGLGLRGRVKKIGVNIVSLLNCGCSFRVS